ncbi:IS1249 family transposase [Corynebacterium aquilae]|uniref:Transposase n=1 Tax=Corynebacterium aquilae DSM 44791 TaxID=1431546 RepID=A0A1L7CFR2_9CORY|nr:IS1249 family transposase [Corynebacterium aquilae]APT84710.1 transposase [Corynebacterium aquilae DSM 44791]
MSKNRPLCPLCAGKMIKNGTTTAGTTRWRCKTCGISDTKRRTDVTDAKWFALFINHVTGNATRADIAKRTNTSLATVDRKFLPYWLVQVPANIDHQRIYDQVFLDGTYLAGGCLLIVSTTKHILNWRWCKQETKHDYTELIKPLAPPLIATIDGGRGAFGAIREVWGTNTVIQRCTFHVFNQVKRRTTTRSRTPQGRQLYAIAKQLPTIKNKEQTVRWQYLLHEFGTVHKQWLNEKSIIIDANGNKKEEFTHYRVRKGYTGLVSLIQRNLLFHYINQPKGIIDPKNIKATTNCLEGGFNAPIKRLADHHRGRTAERQRTMIDWWLYLHTELPGDPNKIARQQQWGRHVLAKVKTDTQTKHTANHDDGRPALYDNAIDREYNHSVGIRQGQF